MIQTFTADGYQWSQLRLWPTHRFLVWHWFTAKYDVKWKTDKEYRR